MISSHPANGYNAAAETKVTSFLAGRRAASQEHANLCPAKVRGAALPFQLDRAPPFVKFAGRSRRLDSR
jgi:hypothetical protein